MISRTLIFLTIFLFWSGGGKNDNEEKPLLAQNNKTHRSAQAAPQTLCLMFAGDIMSQLPQIESAELGGGEYDYTPCFQYIKPVFDQADLVFGNLECTLPGHPPYTGYPNFRSPDQLAEAVKKAGFDILVTANNHAIDGGLEGINHTIETVQKEGFIQTGTFTDALQKKIFYPKIVYKNGFKIALLNYTHHTNGYQTPQPALVNRLVMEGIKHDIATAKKMKPDVIITFLHWGNEHQLLESSEQRGVAQLLHAWGSDLVIGSHPHVVQPIKVESFTVNKKQVNYLTAYSLGNFISSQPFPNTEGGIVFEVNLSKQNNRVQINDYFYIPVLRYTPYQHGRMKFFALPISAFEGHEGDLDMPNDEREKMASFAAKTRAHLEKYGASEHKFEWKEVKMSRE